MNPHPKYELVAKALQAASLDVKDEYALMDLLIKQAEVLLDLRSLVRS